MSEKQLIWDKVGKICIYLLFGLVPVFFLPLTAYPLAENKSILAGLLVFVAFGAWLAKVLNDGRISLPRTKFWFAGIAFLLITGISAFLSSSRQISMWGQLGSPDSFINFLIYGLALFLTPIFIREIGEIIKVLLLFSLALLAISIYSLLQFFGVFIIPFEFARQISFNPVGTVQALSIFLGAGLVMVVALLTSFKLSYMLKIAFSLSAALLSLILILVNFNYVWLGILFASALVVSWQIMHARRQMSDSSKAGNTGHKTASKSNKGDKVMVSPKFGLPVVLMVIVAILFFAQPPISKVVQFPTEVRPSLSATLDIARNSLGEDVTSAIFGSGPSTFTYEYLKYRSSDLNATAFWGVRFAQGFATMPTFLVTLGFLGVGSLIFMIGYFILLGFRGMAALSRKKSHAERTAFISFISFLFLFISWFFYPVNFLIILFTFLFAGVVIASMRSGGVLRELDISLMGSSQRTFLASLSIIVIIVGVIVGIYWQGQKYVASIIHTQGIQAYNKTQDLSKAIDKVNLALSLDGSRDNYWRTFTQLLSLRANEILNDQTLDATQLQGNYEVALNAMIETSRQAIKINPADPLNWRQLASVYETNILIVGQADQFAIENYLEAARRNPNNPAEYLNVARVYVRSADRIQNLITELSQSEDADARRADIENLAAQRAERLSKAIENLDKAISLKNDYSPAYFLSSQVYERQGNRELAIQQTRQTRDLNPLDTGVGYQLGLLYYLDNQVENARDEFERVINLSETFSNARYFLGLSYDRLSDKQKAIEQFERILELNPGNTEVEKILGNLRAGSGALSNIVPPAIPPEARIETPVEETGGERIEGLNELGEGGEGVLE